MFPTPLRALKSLIVVLVVALAMPAAGRAGTYLPGPKETYKAFVIGDSLAGGLWAGLIRQTKDDSTLTVNGRFKEESGLARPEIYDWPRALAGILERNQFEIAIVMIGSNDGHDIRRGAERLQYGTPQWTAAYKENVTALIDILKKANVAVYWVGLPPMQSAAIDDVAKTVTALQREVMNTAGVRFIDIRARFASPDGSYTDSGRDLNGNYIRLRDHNGVNFLRSGNDKLASMVLDVVHADIMAAQSARAATGTVADQNPALGPKRRPAFDAPLFGTELANGEAVRISPLDLPSPDAVAVARIPLPATPDKPAKPTPPPVKKAAPDLALSLSGLKLAGPPGSQAERLFTTGEAPKPQPGRIDDFQVTQPAQ